MIRGPEPSWALGVMATLACPGRLRVLCAMDDIAAITPEVDCTIDFLSRLGDALRSEDLGIEQVQACGGADHGRHPERPFTA